MTLKTAAGTQITLSGSHYVYVNNGELLAAKSVGGFLTLGGGERSSVVFVGSVFDTGLLNPQTGNGNLIVNGVLSSMYTTAVEPAFAHAIQAPFRLLQRYGLKYTTFESGRGSLARLAPRGQVVL